LLRSHKPLFFAVFLGFLSLTWAVVIPIEKYLANTKNDCAKGPEHWCSSIKTAKECHATKHCIQTVWSRHTITEDNDSVCEICKEMVQEARDQLASNETQEELKEVFEGSCNLMPIKLVRLECNKLVDDFVPELTEMLLSQMNPTMVCSVAGLCNNARNDLVQSEYKAAKEYEIATGSTSESCRFCNSHKALISQKIRNFNSADLLNILYNVCGKLNSYSDACGVLVTNNIESIQKTIHESFGEEDMCDRTGFCQNSVVSIVALGGAGKKEPKLSKTTAVKSSEDIQCEFCEALVNHLRDILVSNTTESQFKQVLTSLCQLSGSFAKECLSLTEQYYDVAYNFLLNELDPKQACTLLTLCEDSKTIQVNKLETIAATKIEPASPVVKPVELVPAKVSKTPGCILCEFVLNTVVSDLQNVTIEAAVKQALESVCKKLPSSVEEQCTTLVETYGDAVLYLLVQEIDPATVCTSIKLCLASNNEPVYIPTKPFTSVEPQNPNTCALCEFVLTELYEKVKDKTTEEEIKMELEAVCSYMPKSVRKDCTRLVDAYTEELVEMILASLTPDEICAALHLCTPKLRKTDITLEQFISTLTLDKPAVETAVAKKVEKPSASCIMCEYAMDQLDKQILTNSTEEQLKRMIDFMCAQLPSTVADMCIDFIEEHGDQIFDMLVLKMDPKEVCTELGLCKAKATAVPQIAGAEEKLILETKTEVAATWGTCETCKAVVEYLDKLLEDDTIEESLDKIIDKACVIVPDNSREECKTIVDTYGPYLMNEMAELMDKTKVCQTVHLCKPQAGHVQLLGGERCTWGPSYWCASQQHADACNALSHCQTKVWMKSSP